jgi:hypothetical protein
MLTSGALVLEEIDGEPLIFLPPPQEGGGRHRGKDQAAGRSGNRLSTDRFREGGRMVGNPRGRGKRRQASVTLARFPFVVITTEKLLRDHDVVAAQLL